MNKQGPLNLVLGSTGKTALINRGPPVRTAARSGAEVTFDWTRRDSYGAALDSINITRVYLLAPVVRLDFADHVSAFLDEAVTATTIADPQTHASRAYDLIGPDALPSPKLPP